MVDTPLSLQLWDRQLDCEHLQSTTIYVPPAQALDVMTNHLLGMGVTEK